MYRSEIWLVNLDPTTGAEIKKTRPAVIVNDDAVGVLSLRVIVPITEWQDRYAIAPWMVRVEPTSENNLTKLSAVDTFQVRSVAQERFARKLGRVSSDTMLAITRALAIVLRIKLK